MRARRVAVLADVHGNAVALAAVLAELEREQPDAIVHCGDLTWGPLPGRDRRPARGPWRAVRARQRRPGGDRARRAPAGSGRRGDAARALDGGAARRAAARPARGVSGDGGARGRRARRRALLSRIAPERRGARHGRNARGAPRRRGRRHERRDRSRRRTRTSGTSGSVLGRTFFNPGSVGMPYEGAPGAYWALLGSAGTSGTNGPSDTRSSTGGRRTTSTRRSAATARAAIR